MNKLKECSNIEDCCGASADIGTIVDNTDCVAYIDRCFNSQEEADKALSFYIDKANTTASEPCNIQHKIEKIDNQYKLSASFEFQYQAETLIFQLAVR